MSKKFFLLILTGIVSGIIIACGPSEEKVTQAQQKYRELIETHNQVVAAHEEIADASLDEELVALKGLVDELKAHNLNEMEDEEIDVVINSMDSLVVSYQEYLQKIADIKAAEEAAKENGYEDENGVGDPDAGYRHGHLQLPGSVCDDR